MNAWTLVKLMLDVGWWKGIRLSVAYWWKLWWGYILYLVLNRIVDRNSFPNSQWAKKRLWGSSVKYRSGKNKLRG